MNDQIELQIVEGGQADPEENLFATYDEEILSEGVELQVLDGGLTEAQPAEAEGPDYNRLALEAAHRTLRIFEGNDQVELFLVNPRLSEGFVTAWRALSEELIPAAFRDNVPIVEDEGIEVIHIDTRVQREARYLQNHFGPREQGGTGLIPALLAELDKRRSPVMLGIEFLRFRYLMEMADEVAPRVVVPGASNILMAQTVPTGRRR
jgi:hypothetical protein